MIYEVLTISGDVVGGDVAGCGFVGGFVGGDYKYMNMNDVN